MDQLNARLRPRGTRSFPCLFLAFTAAWLFFQSRAGAQCGDVAEPNDACVDAGSLVCANPPASPLTPTCIFAQGELDYFSFDGVRDELLTATVNAQSLGSGLDAMLALVDVDCLTQLEFNDDFFLGDPRIRTILPADGTYFLIVEGFGGTSEGDYELELSCGPCDGTEPNDTAATAAVVDCQAAPPDPVCIDQPGDVDFFSVSLTQGERITARINAWLFDWPLDPKLTLWDTDGTTLLLQDDNTNGTDPEIRFNAPADGVYFFSVEGAAGTSGLYEIDFQCQAPVCLDVSEPNDYPVQAFGLACVSPADPPVTPTCIDPALDVDLFSFQALEGQRLRARVHAEDIGSGLDAVLTLLAPDGVTELVSANDTLGRDPEIVRYIFADGTYLLKVEGFAGSVGGYELEIACGPCDALEPNDDVSQAQSAACQWPPAAPTASCIHPQGDEDFYAISGTAGQLLTVRVDAYVLDSALDARITLIAPDGFTVVGFDDDTNVLDPQIIALLPSDGTYFVKVDGVAGTVGLYELSVSCRSSLCPDAAEPNDAAWSAYPVDCSPAPGSPPSPTCLDPSTDRDLFSIQAQAGDLLSAWVEAEQIGSSLDAVLLLLDVDGQTQLVRSDDALGLDPALTYVCRETGTYLLVVESFDQSSVGLYDLYVSCLTGQDETEPNDDPAAAFQVSCAAPGNYLDWSTAIDSAAPAEADYFVFFAEAGKTIQVRADAEAAGSALDASLTLLASDGITVLAQAQDTNGTDPALTYEAASTDWYYLRVQGANGTSGFYFLFLECTNNHCDDPAEPNEDAGDAYQLDCTEPPDPAPEPLCINEAYDRDFFSFDALAGQLLIARVEAWNAGTGLDPALRLYDETGDVVAEAFNGIGEDPYLLHRVETGGLHYLEVFPEFDTTGAYWLEVRCKSTGFLLRRQGPGDLNDCAPLDRSQYLPPLAVGPVSLPHVEPGYRPWQRPPDDNACILFYQVDGIPRIALAPDPADPDADILIDAW